MRSCLTNPSETIGTKGTLKLLTLGCMLLCLHLEVAEAAAKPDFRISVKTLRIAQSKTETLTTESGADSKEVNDTLVVDTFPENIELAAFLDNWAVYTYPGQFTAAVMIGYSGWSGFEIGPLLAVRYNNRAIKRDGVTIDTREGRADPGSPLNNAVNLGGYAYYGQPLGATAAWVFEVTLLGWYGIRSGSETTTVPGPTNSAEGPTKLKTKFDGKTWSVALEATLALALADKFEYAPGVALSWSSASTKATRETGTSYESDATTLAWELSLAKFRYTF